jgi:hypothetical protein
MCGIGALIARVCLQVGVGPAEQGALGAAAGGGEWRGLGRWRL